MRRLKKKSSNTDDVQKMLKRIDESSEQLKDSYYVLFDNLNVLFENYPELYKQIEMVVKLPSNDDAKAVVQLNNGLTDLVAHFEDDGYLDNYINPEPVEGEAPELSGDSSLI